MVPLDNARRAHGRVVRCAERSPALGSGTPTRPVIAPIYGSSLKIVSVVKSHSVRHSPNGAPGLGHIKQLGPRPGARRGGVPARPRQRPPRPPAGRRAKTTSACRLHSRSAPARHLGRHKRVQKPAAAAAPQRVARSAAPDLAPARGLVEDAQPQPPHRGIARPRRKHRQPDAASAKARAAKSRRA